MLTRFQGEVVRVQRGHVQSDAFAQQPLQALNLLVQRALQNTDKRPTVSDEADQSAVMNGRFSAFARTRLTTE